jgi:metal transporter CNNM
MAGERCLGPLSAGRGMRAPRPGQLSRMALLGSLLVASPPGAGGHRPGDEAPNVPCCSLEWWVDVVACGMLVLFAAIMSGLTLALISMDSMNLSLILSCGTDRERLYAHAIKPLLQDRHLLLVTLLLGNAVAAETLPIFLDRLLPTRWAILVSVSLLLVFSEIIPQALCSKHKLVVGGLMARFVTFLM